MDHPSLLILLCGSDPMLLETRRMVLERAGYRVIVATGPEQVGPLAAAEPVNVLVLCHSLTSRQADEAITAALARKPTVAILALTGLCKSERHDVPGARTVSRSRPSELLASIARLHIQPHPISPPATPSPTQPGISRR